MIDIMFTCKGCSCTKVPLKVRERKEEEPLDYWFKKVIAKAIQSEHHKLKPGCRSDKFDLYVRAPKQGSSTGLTQDETPHEEPTDVGTPQ